MEKIDKYDNDSIKSRILLLKQMLDLEVYYYKLSKIDFDISNHEGLDIFHCVQVYSDSHIGIINILIDKSLYKKYYNYSYTDIEKKLYSLESSCEEYLLEWINIENKAKYPNIVNYIFFIEALVVTAKSILNDLKEKQESNN
jgi:hypothetical protein